MIFRRWEQWEDDCLRDHYQRDRQRCRDLLPHRTHGAIRHRAGLLKLSKAYHAWTSAEDELLIRLYPDYTAIREALPEHSAVVLKGRIKRLGIQAKPNSWTRPKLERFARMARSGATVDELLREFPERSRKTIEWRRQELVSERHRSDVITGIPLVDDLRERCFSEGIPLRRLGRAVGAHRALQTCAYKQSSILCAAWAERACTLLGGELYVEWED